MSAPDVESLFDSGVRTCPHLTWNPFLSQVRTPLHFNTLFRLCPDEFGEMLPALPKARTSFCPQPRPTGGSERRGPRRAPGNLPFGDACSVVAHICQQKSE
jgi:hypothetical protein